MYVRKYKSRVANNTLYLSRLYQWAFDQHHSNGSMKLVSTLTFIIHGERALMQIVKDLNLAKKKSVETFEFRGYVNIEIPESAERALEAFVADADGVYRAWAETIMDGYSIRQVTDPISNSIRTNLTCMNAASPNFGKSMGAWAETPFLSLVCVLFKHHTIAGGIWGETKSAKKRSFG